MNGTLALWYEPLMADAPAPKLTLHVNLWRDLSSAYNFLDVGLRLSALANLRRFNLYFPVEIDTTQVADLANTLRYGETLKAVFNNLVEEGENFDRCFATTLDGSPYLTVHRVDVAEDLEIRRVASPSGKGTIVAFSDAICTRLRAGGHGDQYLRLRFDLKGPSRDLFTTEVRAGDWPFATSLNVTETTEFRLNERRSYPPLIAGQTARGGFDIERVDYFLVRDIEHQLGSHHNEFRKVRRLEADLWLPYLTGSTSPKDHGPLPAKVIRRMVIYHWSAKAETGKPIDDFIAFATFKGSRAHLLTYAVAIVILGATGSFLQAWFTAVVEAGSDWADASIAATGLVVSTGLLLLFGWLVGRYYSRHAPRTIDGR